LLRLPELLCGFALSARFVDVGAGAPIEWCLYVNHGGQQTHGANLLLAWFGWQSCVAIAARLSAQSTHLRGGDLAFRPGQRPRVLVWRSWSASGLPCAAWVVGGWVVQRCGSSASGGTSGRRSRKVVLAVRWALQSRWMSGRRPRNFVTVEQHMYRPCNARAFY
jgi:hypothetical protein